MNNKITIVEAIYVFYMLRYFTTTYNFAHPLLDFSSNYFKHPIEVIDQPRNLICEFGHDCAIFLSLIVLLRLFNINIINKYILFLIFILSLMNFNALIYLIPFFIYELCKN
jgi:hypothetical protein